jgi:hypothetical protein
MWGSTHFRLFQGRHEPNESANHDRGNDAAWQAFVNSAPIIVDEHLASCDRCCLALGKPQQLCVTTSLHRGKRSATSTLNFFIVEQVPTLPPDTYDKPCPWDRRTTLESWISQRVLKLTCTAEDMLPLADACGFTAGSFQAEYGGRLNKWDEAERAELMAESGRGASSSSISTASPATTWSTSFPRLQGHPRATASPDYSRCYPPALVAARYRGRAEAPRPRIVQTRRLGLKQANYLWSAATCRRFSGLFAKKRLRGGSPQICLPIVSGRSRKRRQVAALQNFACPTRPGRPWIAVSN